MQFLFQSSSSALAKFLFQSSSSALAGLYSSYFKVLPLLLQVYTVPISKFFLCSCKVPISKFFLCSCRSIQFIFQSSSSALAGLYSSYFKVLPLLLQSSNFEVLPLLLQVYTVHISKFFLCSCKVPISKFFLCSCRSIQFLFQSSSSALAKFQFRSSSSALAGLYSSYFKVLPLLLQVYTVPISKFFLCSCKVPISKFFLCSCRSIQFIFQSSSCSCRSMKFLFQWSSSALAGLLSSYFKVIPLLLQVYKASISKFYLCFCRSIKFLFQSFRGGLCFYCDTPWISFIVFLNLYKILGDVGKM